MTLGFTSPLKSRWTVGESLRKKILTGIQVVQISAGFCILRLEVLTRFLQWQSEVIKKHFLVLIMICGVSRWLWLQQKVQQDYTES